MQNNTKFTGSLKQHPSTVNSLGTRPIAEVSTKQKSLLEARPNQQVEQHHPGGPSDFSPWKEEAKRINKSISCCSKQTYAGKAIDRKGTALTSIVSEAQLKALSEKGRADQSLQIKTSTCEGFIVELAEKTEFLITLNDSINSDLVLGSLTELRNEGLKGSDA